jgi:hypothetical protein
MGNARSIRRPGEVVEEVDLRSRIMPPSKQARPPAQVAEPQGGPRQRKAPPAQPFIQKAPPAPAQPKKLHPKDPPVKVKEKLVGPGADPKKNRAWMGNELPVMGPGMVPAIGPPVSQEELIARAKAVAKHGRRRGGELW